MKLLTTITPFWGREDALGSWIRCIVGASIPEVQHLIFFVGCNSPHWFKNEIKSAPVFYEVIRDHPIPPSIGYFHNLGASRCDTEWIMKIDVDALPHTQFFKTLVFRLATTTKTDWFNIGMAYVSRASSSANLDWNKMPLSLLQFIRLQHRTHIHNAPMMKMFDPGGSNFVCNRRHYLDLGGCDARFRGWGWEDYQQLYMLEFARLGKDPLPGLVNLDNVTNRCRDEIARPKAREILRYNKDLLLLHRYHADKQDRQASVLNKRILLDYITAKRDQYGASR